MFFFYRLADLLEENGKIDELQEKTGGSRFSERAQCKSSDLLGNGENWDDTQHGIGKRKNQENTQPKYSILAILTMTNPDGVPLTTPLKPTSQLSYVVGPCIHHSPLCLNQSCQLMRNGFTKSISLSRNRGIKVSLQSFYQFRSTGNISFVYQ